MAYRGYETRDFSFQWDFDRDGAGFTAPAGLEQILPINALIIGGGNAFVIDTINGPGAARWELRAVEAGIALTPIFNPPSVNSFVINRQFINVESEIAFVSTGAAITSGKLVGIFRYIILADGEF